MRSSSPQQLLLPLAERARKVLGMDATPREPCRGVFHLLCQRCGLRVRRSLVCAQQCAPCLAKFDVRARGLRRMLPPVPVRHWTLTLPTAVRATVAKHPAILAKLSRAFVGELFAMSRRHAAVPAGRPTECGAVVVVHRYGATLDRNPHLHAIALDGVYQVGESELTFVPRTSTPSLDELRGIGTRLRELLAHELRRRSLGPSAVSPFTTACKPSLRRLQVINASTTRPQPHLPNTRAAQPQQTRVDIDGMGLFAGGDIDPKDRGGVARLTRYVVHPPITLDALEPGPKDRVRYRLAHPACDGTTHVELSPDELGERLSAIGSERRSGQVSYHGVLAPRAAQRWRVMPTQLVLVDSPRRPRAIGRTEPPPKRPPKRPPKPADRDCPRCAVPMQLIAVEEQDDIMALG